MAYTKSGQAKKMGAMHYPKQDRPMAQTKVGKGTRVPLNPSVTKKTTKASKGSGY